MDKCIKITFEFTRSPAKSLIGVSATKLYDWIDTNCPDNPIVEVAESQEDKEMQAVIDRHKGSGAYK